MGSGKVNVAVVAPGRAIDEPIAARVRAAAAPFASQLNLAFHPQCFLREGHFAGPDEARLLALVEVASDPSVDAVWFARGGYGACRIAADAVAGMGGAARGKTFLGYSDAGFVLAALDRAGIGRPVHGPMPTDILRDQGEAAIKRALAFLSGAVSETLEPTISAQPAAAFNMTVLCAMIGTPLQPDLAGRALLLEEIGEHHYRMDRMMFQIVSAFPRLAGLRLGRCSDIPENDPPFLRTEEEIAQFWCGRAGIPYLGRADIGHDAANRIVPFQRP